MDTDTPLKRAARLAGGPAAFAKALGESGQTVSNWFARGEAPANRCAAIEALTGVSRRELRAKDWKDYWPELEEAAVVTVMPPTEEPADRRHTELRLESNGHAAVGVPPNEERRHAKA